MFPSMRNPITMTFFVPRDHSLPLAHVHLSQKVCVYLSPPPCNIIFPMTFLTSLDKTMRNLYCFDNISIIIFSRTKLFPKAPYKAYHIYMFWEGKGVEQIGWSDKMRWEFISKMQGGLNFLTWFSSFLRLILYFKISEIHLKFESMTNYSWEELNWYPPSVGKKATTLWNFNILKFWENYVFSCMIKYRI
jgi:hypothetical protein